MQAPLRVSRSHLPWWGMLLQVMFALLMIVTGITKLIDMPGFYGIVNSYQSLPAMLVPASSWALALLELGLGLWLLSSRYLLAAAMIVVGLHLMYLGWLTVALLRGLELANCGCFGVFWARPLTPFTLVEDSVLLVLALLLLLATKRAANQATSG